MNPTHILPTYFLRLIELRYVTPCILFSNWRYQHFGRNCCLHILSVRFPDMKTQTVRRYQPTERHNHELSICSHSHHNLPSLHSNTRCTTATEPHKLRTVTQCHCSYNQVNISHIYRTRVDATCLRLPAPCVNVRPVGRTATH